MRDELAFRPIIGMVAPAPVPALPDATRSTSYAVVAPNVGPFAVGFPIYGDGTDYGAWIEVWLSGAQLTAGVDWTLSSPSGSFASLARPITDAVLTLTTPHTGTMYILGARRPRRLAQFSEGRGVTARDENQTYTDIIAMQREMWDRMDRVIQGVPGDDFAQLAPAVRAGTALGFDGAGNLALLPIGSNISITSGATFDTRGMVQLATIDPAIQFIETAGYYLVGDGGAARYKRVGASVPGAVQSLDGAWWEIAEVLHNVKMYGAKGNGAFDDTASFNLALSNVAVVYIPPTTGGGYRITGPLNVTKSNAIIFGSGNGDTCYLNLLGHDFDLFNVTAATNVDFHDFDIKNFATPGIITHARTDGPSDTYWAFFIPDTVGVYLRNISTFQCRSGVLAGADGVAGGSRAWVINCRFNNLATISGVGIYKGSLGEIFEVHGGLCSGPGGPAAVAANNCAAGIYIRAGAGIAISEIELFQCGSPVRIRPFAAGGVAHIAMSGPWCDSSSGIGMDFDGTLGSIIDARIDHWWACGCTNGVRLSGTAQGIKFGGTGTMNGNRADGFNVAAGANIVGLAISGAVEAGANVGAAFSIASGCNNFRISGVQAGFTWLGPNGYGIYLVGLNQFYIITNCDLHGNTSGNLVGHVATATEIAANNIT